MPIDKISSFAYNCYYYINCRAMSPNFCQVTLTLVDRIYTYVVIRVSAADMCSTVQVQNKYRPIGLSYLDPKAVA